MIVLRSGATLNIQLPAHSFVTVERETVDAGQEL